MLKEHNIKILTICASKVREYLRKTGIMKISLENNNLYQAQLNTVWNKNKDKGNKGYLATNEN